MSTGTPVSIVGFSVLCHLCQYDTSVILGGSLGLELNKDTPDPFKPVHDLDLVFLGAGAVDVFIAKKISPLPGATVWFANPTPYPHWNARVMGVPVCLFVNPNATVVREVMGIRIQLADEIQQTKNEIYHGNAKGSS